MTDQHLFKVIFLNQGQVYELYARGVTQGGLLGFVEVEDLVFGGHARVASDPTEQSLENEFEGVKRFYVPMHLVLRIDEVERQGVPRIREVKEEEKKGATVMPFPIPTPPDGGPRRM